MNSSPVAMGCLFRRDGVDPTALPDVGPAYDLWLAFALCRTGFGAYYMRGRMTAWWVHPGQITGTRDEAGTRGSLTCWQAMAEDPIFWPVHRTVRRRLADADRASAYHNLRLEITAQPIPPHDWQSAPGQPTGGRGPLLASASFPAVFQSG